MNYWKIHLFASFNSEKKWYASASSVFDRPAKTVMEKGLEIWFMNGT